MVPGHGAWVISARYRFVSVCFSKPSLVMVQVEPQGVTSLMSSQ
jgi:hypothetical protein